MDTRSAAYIQTVAARTADLLGQALVGVYLHGSAVLGGFIPRRSDIDLLVVTTGPLDNDLRQQVCQALAPSALLCPAAGPPCTPARRRCGPGPPRRAVSLRARRV